jgi:hypothetical protein
MRVQDVIKGGKSRLSVGDWGRGKMPKGKCPLSKAGRRAYSIGSAWEWRFAEFECDGRQFVLRLLFCEDKNKAHMHLGLRSGRDTIVLCSYEYHADQHTGWHLHTLCGEKNEIDSAPAGTLVHGPWVKRLPSARAPHSRTKFNSGYPGLKPWLWSEAVRFFRLEKKGLL